MTKTFDENKLIDDETIINNFLIAVVENHGIAGWYEGGVVYLDTDFEDTGKKLRKKYNFPFKVLPAYENPKY